MLDAIIILAPSFAGAKNGMVLLDQKRLSRSLHIAGLARVNVAYTRCSSCVVQDTSHFRPLLPLHHCALLPALP
jgi:hypothetical protein